MYEKQVQEVVNKDRETIAQINEHTLKSLSGSIDMAEHLIFKLEGTRDKEGKSGCEVPAPARTLFQDAHDMRDAAYRINSQLSHVHDLLGLK